MRPLADGVRRAARAWPMWMALTALAAVLAPALGWRDSLAAADLGLGGFPFNISPREYYDLLAPGQSATLAFAIAVWVFLSGGIIDRLARDSRTGGAGFFAACGACFLPLARLALVGIGACWAVLTWLAPTLAELAARWGEFVTLVLYGVLTATFFGVAVIVDYARVRLVVEDRRSAIGALAASLRLLRARFGPALAIQSVFWLVTVGVIAARGVTLEPLAARMAVPAYLPLAFAAVELLLKLSLTGAQVSLYQQTLASAGWVARQPPAWPDAARAEP